MARTVANRDRHRSLDRALPGTIPVQHDSPMMGWEPSAPGVSGRRTLSSLCRLRPGIGDFLPNAFPTLVRRLNLKRPPSRTRASPQRWSFDILLGVSALKKAASYCTGSRSALKHVAEEASEASVSDFDAEFQSVTGRAEEPGEIEPTRLWSSDGSGLRAAATPHQLAAERVELPVDARVLLEIAQLRSGAIASGSPKAFGCTSGERRHQIHDHRRSAISAHRKPSPMILPIVVRSAGGCTTPGSANATEASHDLIEDQYSAVLK